MRLRRRIARLVRQSRIRLPRAHLRVEEIRAGQWIQLGSRVWKVVRRRSDGDRVELALRSVDGRVVAVLVGPRNPHGRWILEEDGHELVLPNEFLVVFPLV